MKKKFICHTLIYLVMISHSLLEASIDTYASVSRNDEVEYTCPVNQALPFQIVTASSPDIGTITLVDDGLQGGTSIRVRTGGTYFIVANFIVNNSSSVIYNFKLQINGVHYQYLWANSNYSGHTSLSFSGNVILNSGDVLSIVRTGEADSPTVDLMHADWSIMKISANM